MRIFLPLLCVLCATPTHSTLEGTCLRKDPSSGALVLYPGRELVLTCSGDVMVDGVKLRNSSNTKRRDSSPGLTKTTVNIISKTGVSMGSDKHTVEYAVNQGYQSNASLTREDRSLGHTDAGYTTSPTTNMIQPTDVNRLVMAEEIDAEDDYREGEEEEEWKEESRLSRGVKSSQRPQWKWTGRTVGKGDRDMIWRRGATLSLSSVRLTDSGTYTCYHRGRESFSIKVIVADPPETPSLSCYKKSPSSKIRCEATLQNPVTIRPHCYLLLSKSPTEAFLPLQCSYSSRASRCWCALNHHEDELRTNYLAYLCVTSIAGNATSKLLEFTPLGILKPDPPSNVSVRQEEGQETRIVVTWSLPASWKSHDNYYELLYELKYRPHVSSFYHEQVQKMKGQRSYCITDAMPGVEYLIELRTKEEYDGVWSDWSTPVCARSWTVLKSTATMFPIYADIESSGTDNNMTDAAPTFTAVHTNSLEMSTHILWISGSFALLSVILAVYIFRHKGIFISKLQNLSFVSKCGDSPQHLPSAPIAPEGQALVTFGPPCNKEHPEEEEENEEECANERIETVHFNNTSYFFPQQ